MAYNCVQMSKQQKQGQEDGAHAARKHLQVSWRRWLHDKGSTQQQAAAEEASTKAPLVVSFNRFGLLQDQVIPCPHLSSCDHNV